MSEPNNKPTAVQNADAPRADSMGGMAKRLLNPAHLADLAGRSVRTLREEGFEQLWRDITFKVSLAMHKDRWQHRADIPLKRTLKQQRANPIQNGPLISIVVPLYNTPAEYLAQLLDSVRQQTYHNWQLCLVDASTEGHEDVRRTCEAASDQEPRILYQKLKTNEGIAGNTNRGFALATGEYLTLLDHDDLLYPNALYEMAQAIGQTGAQLLYSDEIVLSADLKELGGYHFKPDFAPDYLNGCNYITHLCVFSRALFEKAGGRENSEYDGAQDYDLILRLTEALDSPAQVHHIPKVLYVWRAAAGSTAENLVEAKPYAIAAGARAITDHLARIGCTALVTPVEGGPGAYEVRYTLTGTPMISVIIPNKDHTDDLDRCLRSLYEHAGYENFEVLVVENNSTQKITEAYYKAMVKKYPRCRLVRYEGKFNFSAINNLARKQAQGEYLLLLNNDIEVLTDGFLTELLSYAQRPDVGAVGAKLFYPDDTIQHGGVILGINGSAGHSHKSHPRDAVGDLYRLVTAQNYLAVTGACLLVRTELYDQCGGLDEGDFAVAYNDVDLCLKLYEMGYLNVFTPLAQCYHYESKSRGLDDGSAASAENQARYACEKAAFQARWGHYLPEGADPYYNIHFNNKFENFGLK
ncbi:MAG: glycosyltransferase family 2 protein [Faecalibacterium sp.]|nr:glycosyltransferase family 2 protein [Faecalibacterium sp.]